MFETLDETEIALQTYTQDEGHRYWPYVQSSFNNYWFYVISEVISPDGESRTITFFVREPDDLQSLIDKGLLRITELYLVSPGYINSTDVWKMELIKEIYLAHEPNLDFEQDAYIFILQNDNRYVDSAISTAEDAFIAKKLVYSHLQ